MKLRSWINALVTITLVGLLQTAVPPTADAQEDPNLHEMPYVATSVATDIFVGTLIEAIETIEVGESRYFPRFDTIYRVEVGTVVQGRSEDRRQHHGPTPRRRTGRRT